MAPKPIPKITQNSTQIRGHPDYRLSPPTANHDFSTNKNFVASERAKLKCFMSTVLGIMFFLIFIHLYALVFGLAPWFLYFSGHEQDARDVISDYLHKNGRSFYCQMFYLIMVGIFSIYTLILFKIVRGINQQDPSILRKYSCILLVF